MTDFRYMSDKNAQISTFVWYVDVDPNNLLFEKRTAELYAARLFPNEGPTEREKRIRMRSLHNHIEWVKHTWEVQQELDMLRARLYWTERCFADLLTSGVLDEKAQKHVTKVLRSLAREKKEAETSTRGEKQ